MGELPRGESGGRPGEALLRQWFGYCLAWDTSLQKMMFLVGPPHAEGRQPSARPPEARGGSELHRLQPVEARGKLGALAPLRRQAGQPFFGAINLASVQKKHQILEQLTTAVEFGGDPVSVNAKHRDEYARFLLPTRLDVQLQRELPAFFDTARSVCRATAGR